MFGICADIHEYYTHVTGILYSSLERIKILVISIALMNVESFMIIDIKYFQKDKYYMTRLM